MARSRQNQIMEWLPSYPNGPVEIAFWLGALALLAMVWRRWRTLHSWEDRLVVAVALVMLPLAARAIRNISPFFLLWMPAMSRLISPQARLLWWRKAPVVSVTAPEHPRLNAALVMLALAGAAWAIFISWAKPLPRLGWRPLPAGAIAAVRACPGPLYNRYNEGGYLIWFVPQVPVFVDSRQDPYPASLLTAHATAERTGEFEALFARHGIGCAILPPVSPVARALVARGWRETFRDQEWLVVVSANRPGAPYLR